MIFTECPMTPLFGVFACGYVENKWNDVMGRHAHIKWIFQSFQDTSAMQYRFHLHWISKLFFSRLWSIQDWICLSFVSNSRHLSLFNFLVKFWRTWEEIKSVFVFCRRDKILPKLCIHLKTDLILESDVTANSKLS